MKGYPRGFLTLTKSREVCGRHQSVNPSRMLVAFIKNASARLPLDYAQTGAQEAAFEQVTDGN